MEKQQLCNQVEITGPFYNLKDAAEYCGYSPDHFRHLATEHQVPRCGPNRNRFAASTLNTWMSTPNCFKIKAFTNKRSLKKLEV